MALHWSSVRAIGFSTSTCLPCSAARIAASACSALGMLTYTASTLGLRQRSSTLANVSAPNSPAKRSRASARRSAAAVTLIPGWLASAGRLSVLANPSPATPTRNTGSLHCYFGSILRAQLGPVLRAGLAALLDLRRHDHERRAQRAGVAVVGVADGDLRRRLAPLDVHRPLGHAADLARHLDSSIVVAGSHRVAQAQDRPRAHPALVGPAPRG